MKVIFSSAEEADDTVWVLTDGQSVWSPRQLSGAESYSQAVALPTENSLFPLKDKKVYCAFACQMYPFAC